MKHFSLVAEKRFKFWLNEEILNTDMYFVRNYLYVYYNIKQLCPSKLAHYEAVLCYENQLRDLDLASVQVHVCVCVCMGG